METGLVFGGGGAKGSYEAGVWHALRTLGLEGEISAVSGSSVGGLNAALFARKDFGGCFKIWNSITEKDILCEDCGDVKDVKTEGLLSVLFGGDSFFSQDCLEKIIRSYIDTVTEKDCFIACSDVSRIPFFNILPAEIFINKKLNLKPAYFNLKGMERERAVNVLLATSAIPFIYEGVEIDKKRYCDGGLCDNLPIKPLYDMGIRNIIAVSLDYDTKEDAENFPNADIRLIKPSVDPGNFITGTLNFSKDKLREVMRLGYRDTLNMLYPMKP